MSLPTMPDSARDTPLFTVRTTMSLPLYQKLCWAVSGRRLMLSGALLVLSGAVLVLAFLAPGQSLFWFLLAASLLFPLLLFFSYQRSIRANYESTKFSQGLCAEYVFWPGCLTIQSSISESRIGYDSLYEILETKSAFFLLLGRNQGFVIERSSCPDGLPAFLQSLGKSRPVLFCGYGPAVILPPSCRFCLLLRCFWFLHLFSPGVWGEFSARRFALPRVFLPH